jgi:hypothetical protein
MKIKTFIYFILFALITHTALAEITVVGPTKDKLNLGDMLSVSFTVKEQQDIKGVFSVSLICEDNELPYFVTPISIAAGEEKSFFAPDLTTTETLTGICNIKAALQKMNKEVINETTSSDFTITNELVVSAELSKSTILPEQNILVLGSVETTHEEFSGIDITLKLDDERYGFKSANPSFNYSIKTTPTIKSGYHNILVRAVDEFGNKGETLLTVNVVAVPTTLQIVTDRESFKPKEDLTFEVLLFDQADDSISEESDVVITNPNNQIILSETVPIAEKRTFSIDQYAVPGLYTLNVESAGLSVDKKINILEVTDVEFVLNYQTITIKNTGNIKYKGAIKIKLNSLDKEYLITKSVSLMPSEQTNIDLSKDVSAGDYNISITAEGIAKPFTTYQNIHIDDHRNIFKKTSQSISSITGRFSSSQEEGVLTGKFIYPLLIVIVVILLIALYLKKKQQKGVDETGFKPSEEEQQVKESPPQKIEVAPEKSEETRQLEKQIEEGAKKAQDLTYTIIEDKK